MVARLRKRIDAEDEGFTLIELLVVIIIIGILAAIAIPVFLSQKSKGYEASMKSDLRTAAQEVESQNVDNQDYTKTKFAGANPAVAGTSTVTGQDQNVGNNTNVDLSPGNSILWVGGTASTATTNGAFCLKATSSKTSAVWYYSSSRGGITATACTAASP